MICTRDSTGTKKNIYWQSNENSNEHGTQDRIVQTVLTADMSVFNIQAKLGILFAAGNASMILQGNVGLQLSHNWAGIETLDLSPSPFLLSTPGTWGQGHISNILSAKVWRTALSQYQNNNQPSFNLIWNFVYRRINYITCFREKCLFKRTLLCMQEVMLLSLKLYRTSDV